MKDLEIGIATLRYDKTGEATHASFESTMLLDFDKDLLKQLERVPDSEDAEAIKQNADLVFAGYFSKLNEIELADREQYEVISEIVNCLKYENGKAKECTIRFLFRQRVPEKV